jgi:hypothetical protein
MRKALRLMAVLTAFGLTAWIGVVALAQGSSAPTPSTWTSTTTSPPSTGVDDVKGNCDEAEHANDPGCLGVIPMTEDDPANDDQGDDVNDDNGGEVNDDDQGDDVSDDQGENEDDDQGDVNHDDQGEDEGNDDQGNDQDDNSGPSSVNSGPGSSKSGSGS